MNYFKKNKGLNRKYSQFQQDIAKLKRWLGITKEIKLSPYQKILIGLTKNHYKAITEKRSLFESLGVYYDHFYALNHKDHDADFKRCMFEKMFEIFMLIRDDRSGHNVTIKELLYASFYKSPARPYEVPMERVILELWGQIQCTTYLDDYGLKRYSLDIDDQIMNEYLSQFIYLYKDKDVKIKTKKAA